MGGPYGAVAGAPWEGRKHTGKIVAAVAVLLLLSVLFILILPALALDGISIHAPREGGDSKNSQNFKLFLQQSDNSYKYSLQAPAVFQK